MDSQRTRNGSATSSGDVSTVKAAATQWRPLDFIPSESNAKKRYERTVLKGPKPPCDSRNFTPTARAN